MNLRSYLSDLSKIFNIDELRVGESAKIQATKNIPLWQLLSYENIITCTYY